MMIKINEKNRVIISFRQLFLIALAQMGGAAIIYLPGVGEAGRDVWISNIIASVLGYLVIYMHYLPQSQCPGSSMTEIINQYWGKVIGGVVNLYYLMFFFLLCCLIVSDVYYFGITTMPETPGYVFIIFFLIPAIYAMKLGLEPMARLLEILLPLIIIVYSSLFVLAMPKLDFENLTPIMSGGIKPVLAGALPNLNFPYAQILPVVFLHQYTRSDRKDKGKFLIYIFAAILLATILLSFRALAAITAFDEETLKILTYPPFSTIRIIEIGEVIERLDALFLGVFYATTFFKFILTYYVICKIITDYFKVGEAYYYAVPIAVLIGISMPYLIPRFDIILNSVVPHFYVILPLLLPIPLALYWTIRVKKKG